MQINYKPELFKRSTDILFEAYSNDSLKHDNCICCAVGNLVQAGMGISATELHASFERGESWARVFYTDGFHHQTINMSCYKDGGRKQIDSTGYTVEQLSKIEHAFETAPMGDSSEDYMFNGLVAVLEILKEIHQASDDDETLPRFESTYRTKLRGRKSITQDDACAVVSA